MKPPFYLLLICLWWVTCYEASGQTIPKGLNDLAYVVESTDSEAFIEEAIVDLHQSTGVQLKVTLLYEQDDLQQSIQGRHQQWLQEQEKGISLLIEVGQQGKYYHNMQMQVGTALKQLLDEERKKQLIAEVMEPAFEGLPLPEDACVRGLLVSIKVLKKLLLQPQAAPADGNFSTSQQQDDEETAMTDGILSDDPERNNMQQHLIKEVLDSLAEEGKRRLEHSGKIPLDEKLPRSKLPLPTCLSEGEAGLQKVLGKINAYLEDPDTLLNLLKEDEANKSRIAALTATLIGVQPPYRTALTADEWDELKVMVCPYLQPDEIEEPILIEGLSMNVDLVAINTITDSFKPGSGRLDITYTLRDTLGLAYNKLEIFRIEEKDTIIVTSFIDLVNDEKVEFKEKNEKGWSGKGVDGQFVKAGNYLVKLTAATDKLYTHGFEDYKTVEVKEHMVISTKEMLEQTYEATTIATKFTGNTTSSACNICVRSALYLLRSEPTLFPTKGSGFHDPKNNYVPREIKGYITDPGRAKNIKINFDAIAGKIELYDRFKEISKIADESWEEYFQRLQDKADAGGIVIGVMLNSSGSDGHVMMITPGGIVNIETESEDDYVPKWGFSFTNRDILNVPRVLECGTGSRNDQAPLCRNVDFKGATQRLKWFIYLK